MSPRVKGRPLEHSEQTPDHQPPIGAPAPLAGAGRGGGSRCPPMGLRDPPPNLPHKGGGVRRYSSS